MYIYIYMCTKPNPERLSVGGCGAQPGCPLESRVEGVGCME